MLEKLTFDDSQIVLLRDKGNGRKELVATCTGPNREENAKVLASAEDRIAFKVNEQNALALLCMLMSSVSHSVLSTGKWTDEDCAIHLFDVVHKFPNTNWGDLYDKFHRRGVNR